VMFFADSTVSERRSTSETEATKAPLPMATEEDSKYDKSGGSREGEGRVLRHPRQVPTIVWW
jgi:hypothetical protein